MVLSLTEMEYVTLTLAFKEVIWLRVLLTQLGFFHNENSMQKSWLLKEMLERLRLSQAFEIKRRRSWNT